MVTRERTLPWSGPTKAHLIVGSASPFYETRVDSDREIDYSLVYHSLDGRQVTVSESHPSWRHKKTYVFKGDQGGPFSTASEYVEILGDPELSFAASNTDPQTHATDWFKYRGFQYPCEPTKLSYPGNVSSDSSALDKLGATAVARTSPSKAAAPLTVFLGETLKDGIPHLIGGTLTALRNMTHRERKRALGHEYLNYQFGWLPFVSDLHKLFRAMEHSDAIWRQFADNQGQLVRRKYAFPAFESTEMDIISTGVSSHTGMTTQQMIKPGFDFPAKLYRELNTYRRQWFSGAFSYSFPTSSNGVINEISEKIIKARKLYGLSLTPDDIWNLAPWSWAVDWFVNAGDNLQNWTDQIIDGQALMYGYMMEHSIASYTYTLVGPTGLLSSKPPCSIRMVNETKLRQKSSPFGFGLTWDSFTPKQVAIATALGLTRGKK